MVDMCLSQFVFGRDNLGMALREARAACRVNRHDKIPEGRFPQVSMWVLGAVAGCVDSIDLRESRITGPKLQTLIANHGFQPISWGDLFENLKRLDEEINIGIDAEWFFHYTRKNARMIIDIEKEWESSIKAFKAVKLEATHGTQCYAMGNYIGCVFHMSRIAEIGLRAIGKERGVKSLKRKRKKPIPIEYANWGEVFDAIEPTLEGIRKTWSRGPQKEAALYFYNSALTDLRHMQGYRDSTMHFRAEYDFGEAESAMFRARSLMTNLASKIDENTSRAISRSAWK